MRSNAKNMWVVKTERPEEIYKNPEIFYTKEEAERYSNSSGMKNTQHKIAKRVLQLLEIENGKGKTLLDLGCGTGNTLEVFEESEFNCVGLDISKEMLKFAKEKGFKTKQGSITELHKFFPISKFDFVISISALQWLKEKKEYQKAISSISWVLKKNGKCVIQFYPGTEKELELVRNVILDAGYTLETIIDNPDNPRKRLVFLVFY
ncbi:MAG: methyltransferase domain-containing protein [Candidatus ainarchaeum sp.]|nr:methyltransferase domain-containing protein [Candidatus ainarchaeum sp.]